MLSTAGLYQPNRHHACGASGKPRNHWRWEEDPHRPGEQPLSAQDNRHQQGCARILVSDFQSALPDMDWIETATDPMRWSRLARLLPLPSGWSRPSMFWKPGQCQRCSEVPWLATARRRIELRCCHRRHFSAGRRMPAPGHTSRSIPRVTAPSGSSHRSSAIAVQQQPLARNEPGFMNAPVNAIRAGGHEPSVAGANRLLCGSINPQMTQLQRMIYSSNRRPE